MSSLPLIKIRRDSMLSVGNGYFCILRADSVFSMRNNVKVHDLLKR